MVIGREDGGKCFGALEGDFFYEIGTNICRWMIKLRCNRS